MKRFPPVSLSYPLNFPKSIMQLFPHPPLSLSTLRQECVRRPSERERTSGSLVHHSHPRTADSLSLSLFLPLPEKVKNLRRARFQTHSSKKEACMLLFSSACWTHTTACQCVYECARVTSRERERVRVCVGECAAWCTLQTGPPFQRATQQQGRQLPLGKRPFTRSYPSTPPHHFGVQPFGLAI